MLARPFHPGVFRREQAGIDRVRPQQRRRCRRDTEATTDVRAELPDISVTGQPNDIGREPPHDLGDTVGQAPHRDVVGNPAPAFEGEDSRSPQVEACDGSVSHQTRFTSRPHRQQRHVLSFGMGLDRGGQAAGLARGIGEQCNSRHGFDDRRKASRAGDVGKYGM
jgi:hypothetical protein